MVTTGNSTPVRDSDATTATVRLPGLDIESVHHRAPDGTSERLSINLQAVPSFEAFGRTLETVNPFAIWAQTVQLLWSPWLAATRALTPPGAAALFLPAADGSSRTQSGPPQAPEQRAAT